MSEQEQKVETAPNYAKIYLIKCQNLERTINLQKNEIKKLSTDLLQANKDKEDLKVFIRNNSALKEEIQNLKEELLNTRNENYERIKKKDDEISKLTCQISALESKMQLDKSNFDKNTDIYRSKMNTLTYLQMDNKAYQEEIAALQKEQEDYKNKVEADMKLEKKNNFLKIENFKQKMVNNLRKTNEDMKSFNYEFMGANNKLLQRQNQQLFMQIDKKNDIIKDLHKEIQKLKDKIYQNEKDMDMHKLVEYNLAQQLIEKGHNTSKKRNKKTKTFINSTQMRFPTLRKNQSENEIFPKQHILNLNTNKKNYNIRNNSIDELDNNFTQKMNLNLGKKITVYQKELQEKNIEIEKEQLINVQLRNKLNVYKSKFKGLVNFLEENLQNLSKDEKIMAKTNFNTKAEKIKKCEFEEFTMEEKKELLGVLIKYLLPLANPDIDYSGNNDSKTYFNTNLSITKMKNINNKNYLNDNVLKKAFVDKASKYHKDILNGRTLIYSSSKHDSFENNQI
jgi:hypothetical protein